MELILLLCSSGVAGLFTYIYLDYLSLFDTERPEIKRMLSILFSLISIGIYLIIVYFVSFIPIYAILNTIISFVIAIIVIYILNKSLYVKMIKKFRYNMNKERKNNKLNPFNEQHAIDTILQTANMFYIEKYKDDSKPIHQGILLHHQLTDDLDSIFVLEPTPIIKNDEKVIKEYYYQPKSTDEYYKIYSLKN